MLIVDDDDDMRELVKLRLELADDLEVVAEAVDGPGALETFQQLGAPPIPDVVILDNRMPGMTGIEVAAEMRGLVPQQRIVLFTAYADHDAMTRAAELAVDVLSKERIADLVDLLRSPLDNPTDIGVGTPPLASLACDAARTVSAGRVGSDGATITSVSRRV